ncbi:MAG TPA: 2-dehydropantoate 2-reductase [Acidimicrobiales bacterium]|nr:2-dehydropantoate 2-reductase [Acidimicrobiales bacterium]
MRFSIVGAGAIGAYVGACLARGGEDVTLIARGAHLRAMQEHGVTVDGQFTVPVEATDDLAAITGSDVVFVALKAYSLPAMAAGIAGHLRAGAATVWAQNGVPWWYADGLDSVDPGGAIARAIPRESVVGCVVYCSTEIVAPGVVRHVEGTRFSIGEPGGGPSDRCRAIAEAFARGGLKAPTSKDLPGEIWLKLVGNVAFNPISALTGATLGELGSQPEAVDVIRAMFGECACVAEHLGVRFPVALERRMQAGFAVGDHKTSMLQDLEAGKPLELDCLSGAVIELADRFGVAVPHVRTVHACAKLLASRSGTVA